MELNDEQKMIVAGWAREGCGLSEIQKKLSSELDIDMTYMDVRFMMIDIEVEVQDKEIAETPDLSKMPDTPPGSAGEEGIQDSAGPGGAVSVDVDKLMRPGSLVSGSVVFSDGVSAKWMLDQSGRLALDASQPDYRPSEKDMEAFQNQLRNVLQKHGY